VNQPNESLEQQLARAGSMFVSPPVTATKQVAAEETDDEDDGEGHAFTNGENEVLFELADLDDAQLKAFETRLRRLLSKFEAYSIVVNNSDWD
jgi:hypothetical protein